MPDRLASSGEAGRAVGQEALILLFTDREAEVRARITAVNALAALWREERHHVVAGTERLHVPAHPFHDARSLVAEHRRRVARGIGPGRGVEIGVADPAGDEPDEDFACLRLREVDFLHRERSVELLENRCPDAHAPIIVEPMARIRPFEALRYDVPELADVVAPPYDVISEDQRAGFLARSPYNVVHLTLPDSEEQAARDLAEWRASGVLVEEEEPSYWWLSQDYVGPDGVQRTREGFVAALRVEPYENRVILPHERTHAGPKEGRLRLLEATRTELEPIFLLWDGTIAIDGLDGPDIVVEEGGVTSHLWRLGAEFGDVLTEEIADAQLLIADGHHRYETALAFHRQEGTEESAWLLVVIVPTGQEGLTIFPTHRVAQSVDGVSGTPIDPPGDDLPGLVLYRQGRYELLESDALDPEAVDRLAPRGVAYTPYASEAVAAVDRGDAEAAFLLRPTRIEDVWEIAARGEVMPQKSTFFYPKLTSGLLLLPL
jgi:uncharacterized protein (DUF1015 family)